MSSPVCPADFQKANFGSSTCDLLTQLLLTNEKLYKFFSWMFDPTTCKLTPEFVAEFQGVLQPIGSVIWSPVPLTFPDGEEQWVEANGRYLDKEDYPELFAVYGTTFGGDEASDDFRIPDLQG